MNKKKLYTVVLNYNFILTELFMTLGLEFPSIDTSFKEFKKPNISNFGSLFESRFTKLEMSILIVPKIKIQPSETNKSKLVNNEQIWNGAYRLSFYNTSWRKCQQYWRDYSSFVLFPPIVYFCQASNCLISSSQIQFGWKLQHSRSCSRFDNISNEN